MTSSFIRSFAGVATAVTLLAAPSLSAQTGVGAHLTPFAGYLITGNWYDGPIGTSIATTNAPMLGVQGPSRLPAASRWLAVWATPLATCG